MKKLVLALVCLVSVAFFASCEKEKEAGNPTINFVQDEGYISSDATIEADTPFMFGIQAKSNETTKELLTDCYIQIFNGDERYWDTLVENINQEQYNFDAQLALPEGVYTISASVHNAAANAAECRMTITSIVTDIELVPTDFTWNRHGGDAATGLAEYGLEWNSNAKEVFAQIKPMAGYTLYEFEPATWDTINTQNAKDAFFNTIAEFPSIAVFNKVSAFASHDDLDYVIGTVEQATGKAYLMHITKNVVSTFKGTDVTINGQAK